MNKQEVISKLKSAIPKNNVDDYQKGATAGLNFALLLLAELDEPEKPKEKLYTVEIPNPNSAGGKMVLSKQQSTGRLILEMLNSDINKPKYLHLTEDEIKKDFGWAWRFAKDVEE